MPPVEPALAGRPVGAPATIPGAVAGWGGGPAVPVSQLRAAGVSQLQCAVAADARPAIARGKGRSYGDAAQLSGGVVLDTARLTAFELDGERGSVWAQSGVTLGGLLAALRPAGWVLPVVPGTQHVTIGGAIAADIHGKNHGSAGTFGAHVTELGLLTAAGDVLELAPGDGGDILAATIGGMGLTGVILWARIRLAPLRNAMLSVDVDRVQRLDDALAVLDGPGGSHRVAWLDLLSRRPVRGVVTRADQRAEASTDEEARALTTVAARAAVPARWPGGILRPEVVRAYNAYRFHRTPPRATGLPEPFGTHMFPLDVLDAWPRLYGPAGFVQYQLVVPRGEERALERVIERLRAGEVPCYLAVLKDFGPENDAPLSFPLRGWTLALDLPRAAPGLGRLLDDLDERVMSAAGRVYLAKDSHLRAGTLAAMYPRLAQWRAVRDRVDPTGRWRSDLGVRVGLVEAG